MPMLLINQFSDAIPGLLAEERLAALDLGIAGHSVAMDKQAFDGLRRALQRQVDQSQPRIRPRKASPKDLAMMGIGLRQTQPLSQQVTGREDV